MRLMVVVDPLDKEADQIVRTQGRAAGIHEQVFHQSTFFLSIRLIPGAERSTDKCEVLFAFDPMSNLVAHRFQSINDLNESACQVAQLLAVFFKPLLLELVYLLLIRVSGKGSGSGDESSNPRNAPESRHEKAVIAALAIPTQGAIQFTPDLLLQVSRAENDDVLTGHPAIITLRSHFRRQH